MREEGRTKGLIDPKRDNKQRTCHEGFPLMSTNFPIFFNSSPVAWFTGRIKGKVLTLQLFPSRKFASVPHILLSFFHRLFATRLNTPCRYLHQRTERWTCNRDATSSIISCRTSITTGFRSFLTLWSISSLHYTCKISLISIYFL